MKLAGALFDFDGTILSNERYHKEAVRSVLESYLSDKVGVDELRPLTGLTYYDRLVHLLAKRGIDDDELTDQLEKQARDRYLEIHSIDGAIVPGLPLLLQRLSDAGVIMAVVTSARHDYTVDHLERADLAHFFASVTGRDDVERKKPDPQPYEQNLAAHKIAREATVVFEDSPPGLAAGVAAGLPVVGILTNFTQEELPGAALYIRDYTELTVDKLEALL